ncbi:NHL repeat-containing protein [Changchengzhania lutea]|uniref:hypothetical protein n=1 Tax=Changchengzhania lutea TaxID=2049305 RepID=UPI00115D2D98|nr:hypothetical protein [Changchengzhania lutea]
MHNNQVQIFDLKGNFVRMIGWNETIKAAKGVKVTDIQVIFADFEGSRVLVYDLNGNLIQIISGEFNQPTDIVIVSNKIFVVNYKGKKASVFKN